MLLNEWMHNCIQEWREHHAGSTGLATLSILQSDMPFLSASYVSDMATHLTYASVSEIGFAIFTIFENFIYIIGSKADTHNDHPSTGSFLKCVQFLMSSEVPWRLAASFQSLNLFSSSLPASHPQLNVCIQISFSYKIPVSAWGIPSSEYRRILINLQRLYFQIVTFTGSRIF